MAIQTTKMMSGIIHSDWTAAPDNHKSNTRTATASATLKLELRFDMTFSMGFMIHSAGCNIMIASINECYHAVTMKASKDEVRAMVGALFVTNTGLDRARRQKKGASTLSMLQVVAANPGVRPSEIASAQDVHPSQVTRQVRDLESQGLLKVTADIADRRSCRVTLTSSGTKELRRLTEIGLDRFGSFVADWEAEEVRMLTSLLKKLEASKAKVAAEQRPPVGRRWALGRRERSSR